MHWLAAHSIALLYLVVLLLLLYFPPELLSKRGGFQGLGEFIGRHWGDSIGLYLVHIGILLIILAGAYPQLADAGHVGESFILTGVGLLKLKYIPKEGNNNGPPAPTPTPSPPANPTPAGPAEPAK